MSKFPTSHVMTVYTGYCMGTGIGMAQDVFDCLYPGIMTLGCMAMHPNAVKELERQFPALAEIAPIESGKHNDYLRFLREAEAKFGGEMDVAGPAADGPPDNLALELKTLAEHRRKQ